MEQKTGRGRLRSSLARTLFAAIPVPRAPIAATPSPVPGIRERRGLKARLLVAARGCAVSPTYHFVSLLFTLWSNLACVL